MTNREKAVTIVDWYYITRPLGEESLSQRIEAALNKAEALGRKAGLDEAIQAINWAKPGCVECGEPRAGEILRKLVGLIREKLDHEV